MPEMLEPVRAVRSSLCAAMTRVITVCVSIAVFLFSLVPSAQTVYPTGTTIYDPDRSWNGFTVLSPLGTQAVLVIDMNGTVVKRWDDLNNSAGGPARVLPGGHVISASGARPPHQESLELVQRDFDGKVVWQFNRGEREGRHRVGLAGIRPQRRDGVRAGRARGDQGGRGIQQGARQLRLAARQLGNLRRAEPVVRQGRHAFRPEPRHHQQP